MKKEFYFYGMKRGTVSLGILFVVFAILCLGLSFFYAAWYTQAGGWRQERYKRFVAIAAWNPDDKVREAIAAGDFRLYTVGNVTDYRVPGLGGLRRDYIDHYGSVPLFLPDMRQLSDEQMSVVEKARGNLVRYNVTVYGAGLLRLPPPDDRPGARDP